MFLLSVPVNSQPQSGVQRAGAPGTGSSTCSAVEVIMGLSLGTMSPCVSLTAAGPAGHEHAMECCVQRLRIPGILYCINY